MDEENSKNEEIKEETKTPIYTPADRKLALGLWLIENKKRLRAALVIFLVLVAGISWSYTIYGFAYYIIKGMGDDEILVSQITQETVIGHNYILKMAPQDLIFSAPLALKASEDKYDFLVEVKNPNPRHWASLSYCFSQGGKEIDCGQSFILPEGEKIISVLAKTFKTRPTSLNFIVKEFSWGRISPHKFPDWENFRDEHLAISVEDIDFKPAATSGLSEKLNLNTLKFSANNKTPFNYWEVPFTILLSRGNSIIGINKYTATELMSKEKREIEMSWLGNLSGVNNIKIIPEINILEDDIYIKYEGGIGEEK